MAYYIKLNRGIEMEEQKYHLYKKENQDGYLYLEMHGLSDVAVEIWQESSGEKKTHVRIKFTDAEWEKLINEYQRIQAIQKTD